MTDTAAEFRRGLAKLGVNIPDQDAHRLRNLSGPELLKVVNELSKETPKPLKPPVGYAHIRSRIGLGCEHDVFPAPVGLTTKKVNTSDHGSDVPLFDKSGNKLHSICRAEPPGDRGKLLTTSPTAANRSLSAEQRAVVALRKKVVAQGLREGCDLARTLDAYDTHSTGRLGFADFSRALGRTGVQLSESEQRLLFAGEQRDSQGRISHRAFMHRVHSWDEDTGVSLGMALEPQEADRRRIRKYANNYERSQRSDSIFGLTHAAAAPHVTAVASGTTGASNGGDGRQHFSQAEKVQALSQQKLLQRLAAEPEALRDALAANDSNRNGTVELPEFRRGLRDMGVVVSESDAGRLFNDLLPPGASSVAYHALANNLKQQALAVARPGQMRATNHTNSQRSRKIVLQRVTDTLRSRSEDLGRVFRDMDYNGDGFVDLREFRKGLAETGVVMSDADSKLLFEHLDRTEDGSTGRGRANWHNMLKNLNANDFRRANSFMLRQRSLPPHLKTNSLFIGDIDPESHGVRHVSRLEKQADVARQKLVDKVRSKWSSAKKAFRAMDLDHNGVIDYNEFRSGLTNLGLVLSEQDCRTLFAHGDGDNSGTLDYEEFGRGLGMGADVAGVEQGSGSGGASAHSRSRLVRGTLGDRQLMSPDFFQSHQWGHEMLEHVPPPNSKASRWVESSRKERTDAFATAKIFRSIVDRVSQLEEETVALHGRSPGPTTYAKTTTHAIGGTGDVRSLEAAFRGLDTGPRGIAAGSGLVPFEGFKKGLGRLGVVLGTDDAAAVFKFAGAGADNCIDSRRFIAAVHAARQHKSAVESKGVRFEAESTGPPVSLVDASGHAVHCVGSRSAQEPVNPTGTTPHKPPQLDWSEKGPCGDVIRKLRSVVPRNPTAATNFLTHVFRRFDGDADGVVSRPEFKRGLSLLGGVVTAADISRLSELMDPSRSGCIDYKQFTSHILGPPSAFTGGDHTQSSYTFLPDPNELHDDPAAPTNYRWEAFKAGWVTRHGAAAKKELALDTEIRREAKLGPTWTSAQPQPFRVLHMTKHAPVSPLRQRR